MRAIGFVFARGGSKGVPGKNLRRLGGVPLVGRAVAAALESGTVERVIVSTDDEEIARAAVAHGAEAPWLRPDELAADTANEWDAWRHAVDTVTASDGDFDVFVSVPATAPLRSPGDIRRAVDRYLEGRADLVLTIRKSSVNPYFNMVTEGHDGSLHVVGRDLGSFTRRQDAPVVFDITPVAYVTSPDYIRRASGLFDGRVEGVEVPRNRAVDIDDEEDLDFAEFLLSRTP